MLLSTQGASACSKARQVHFDDRFGSYSCHRLSHEVSCAGTGKTLSLICSILQWLEDKQPQEGAAPAADHEGGFSRCSGNMCICLDHKWWSFFLYLFTLSTPATGSDLPDWLAAPTCCQKETTKPSSIARHKQQRHMQTKPKALSTNAVSPAEAACHSSDASEAEHLLDAWESDTDEPAKTGKHR